MSPFVCPADTMFYPVTLCAPALPVIQIFIDPSVAYPELVSRFFFSKSRTFKRLVKIGASKGVTPLNEKKSWPRGGGVPGNQKTTLDTPLPLQTSLYDMFGECTCLSVGMSNTLELSAIYLIIRRCARTGAFPGAFCVPNSVALASLTLQVVNWAIH